MFKLKEEPCALVDDCRLYQRGRGRNREIDAVHRAFVRDLSSGPAYYAKVALGKERHPSLARERAVMCVCMCVYIYIYIYIYIE